jgi:DNA repair exonuclease SbcCD nuclease subunit
MTRFIHTADWQLGMTRHFLGDEAQARFTQARIDAIRTIGRLAIEKKAEFAVVAGDVFESNLLSPQVVARSLLALREIPIPWYLLPGNHDPLDASSIYDQKLFQEQKPENVHVLRDSNPFEVAPGVDLVGAPWPTKRPLADLAGAAVSKLSPSDGRTRICVAHGAVDIDAPDKENPANILFENARQAISDGRIHYLALGDRHSSTVVGENPQIRYSGAPEPTDYDEVRPGFALLVDLSPQKCKVEELPVAKWKFLRSIFDLAGDSDVDRVQSFCDKIPSKETAVVKLAFRGTLSLAGHAKLMVLLQEQGHVLAALESWESESDLVLRPSPADLEAVNLTGYAKNAMGELLGLVERGGPDQEVAEDALALMYRLSLAERRAGAGDPS